MPAKKRKSSKSTTVPEEPLDVQKKSITSSAMSADNLVILGGILSVLLSILITVKVITPLLMAASAFPFFLKALKKGLARKATVLVFRWALTVCICVIITGGFASERAEKSFSFAKQSVETIQRWIGEGNGAPPADFTYLLGGGLVFVAAAASSAGALGFVIGALGLTSSGYGAAYLFRQGDNIFHVLLIAIPPWQLCLFAAGIFLFVPAASIFFKRFFSNKGPSERRHIQLCTYLGAGLFLLSFILRIATAGTWRTLTERWTLF